MIASNPSPAVALLERARRPSKIRRRGVGAPMNGGLMIGQYDGSPAYRWCALVRRDSCEGVALALVATCQMSTVAGFP